MDAFYPVQIQNPLGREISAKVFAVSEWNAKVKAKSAFTTDVLRKAKASHAQITHFGLYSAGPARLASRPMLILATKRTKTIKKPNGGLLEVCAR